jgi:plastocyanin
MGIRAKTVGAAASAMLVLGVLSPLAPTSQAHTGESFCETSFAAVGEGPVRVADGTQAGHGEGRCTTAFQGFPMGVIGRFDAVSTTTGATDPTAPAEIHVEVWLHVSGYAPQKIAECEDGNPALPGGELRFGTAECSAEGSWRTGVPFTLPEPVSEDVAYVECLAHTHARVKTGTAPVARFGCYSTDESEAELRADMGLPPADGEGGEGGGGAPALPGLPEGVAAAPPGAIVSVTPNGYDVGRAVVTPSSLLTYVNLDEGVYHDVVALEATRPAGSAPWCADPRFADGCPLFYTPLIEGGAGSTTPVKGLARAEAGDYAFFCTIHPTMRGTITVVGA